MPANQHTTVPIPDQCCRTCGASLPATEAGHVHPRRIYCSVRCSRRAQDRKRALARPRAATCKHCGSTIVRPHGHKLYCSRDCGRKACIENTAKFLRKLPPVACKRCGRVVKCHRVDQNYCSRECRTRSVARAIKGPTPRVCRGCGAGFLGTRMAAYCSSECRYHNKYERFKQADPGKRESRRERNSFYATARWRRLRRAFLEAHPHCSRCLRDGRETPSSIAHHVIERLERPDLAYEMSNLSALCRPCHSGLHIRLRGAAWEDRENRRV